MKLIIILTFALGAISCDSTREPSAVDRVKLRLSESYIGEDMFGEKRTCIDKFDQLSCTQQFSDADAFALTCEREGKYAIQCGCHDWICVDSIGAEAESNY